MENSSLKGRILTEIENLISQSCANQKTTSKFEKFHIALLKKHYNAAEVSIDYHRKRVKMNIVMDDTCYDPKTINLYLPMLHVNLFFKNLKEFLKSCIEQDSKSLGFYAGLLRSFTNKEVTLMVV
ncbi:hypothetical protein [Ulvibacterium sp.]|uniref:hypothetical protein n=1 Tax=Ulvibacterium sp. TaxID=2665914 RepID=UPI00261545DA|nr:hypothetical protein [Ulvibacterium sp.]